MISSYPSIYNLGHPAVRDLLNHPVQVEEKVDGCVTLDTPILMADLTWKKAENIVVGDEVIGLEYTGNRLRLVRGIVTVAIPIVKECVSVVTDKTTTIVSKDHPFWTRLTTSNNPSKWTEAQELPIGVSIPYIPTWETDKSWEGGYLAGQFDGEGSLVKHGKSQRILSYYQKVSPSQEFVKTILTSKGFSIREDFRQRKLEYKEMWTAIIAGGWGEILRFLGSIRPRRLLEKAEKCWSGGAVNGLDKAKVLSVTNAGEQWVMGLSTSCKTYWAGGLASHNSQFSFQLLADDTIAFRSKGQEITEDNAQKMWMGAIEHITINGMLTPGYIYRAECLFRPKHNVLAYNRKPFGDLVLYDVERDDGTFLTWHEKLSESIILGIDVVPLLGIYTNMRQEELDNLLTLESFLGGPKIEGVVIKPVGYNLYGQDKKVLMGKFVSEAFKEQHKQAWPKSESLDIASMLAAEFSNPPRWRKSLQHMNEDGLVTNSYKDIGPLVMAVLEDIKKEGKEEIMEAMWSHFWPAIAKKSGHGIAEWYKQYLVEEQFKTEVEDGKED